MGIFNGCLLASDIDGTLLTNGKIPQSNLEKIDWFKSEGGIFTICTGRTPNAAKYSYELSHSNAPLIAFHGGGIFSYPENKFIHQTIMSNSCHTVVKQIMNVFPEVGVEVHSGVELYPLHLNDVIINHADYEDLSFSDCPEDIFSLPWNKVFFGVKDEKTVRKMYDFSHQFKNENCRFMITQIRNNACYLEMVPENVNKGDALKYLKKIIGADICFGIGDYFNDLELIRDADIGAVTADAPDELKLIADYVTCPCEKGSVADFIDKIALYMKGSNLWTK